MKRTGVVSSTDVALLRALGRERSLVAASRRVGISRDRAVYRIGRLARAFGGPVVASVRGGAGHGGTVLTALGDRIARGGFGSVELLDGQPSGPASLPNRLRGIYHRGPSPRLRLGPDLALRVAFEATDGAPLTVLLDPESVLVARRRFPSSARNVIAAEVDHLGSGDGPGARTLVARRGRHRFRVTVTPATVRELGLRAGRRVYLYVKATALRPAAPAAA